MLLRPEQLAAHLKRELRPVYTVWGDEPLLAQEACDAIRAAARAGGCGEREGGGLARGERGHGAPLRGRQCGGGRRATQRVAAS